MVVCENYFLVQSEFSVHSTTEFLFIDNHNKLFMDQSKVSTIPAGYFDSIQEIVWNSYCSNIQELANDIDCLSQHVSFSELVQRSHAPN